MNGAQPFITTLLIRLNAYRNEHNRDNENEINTWNDQSELPVSFLLLGNKSAVITSHIILA